MNFKSILRILGILITLLSLTLIPPMIVALIYEDSGGLSLLESFFITLSLGGFLWYRFRTHKRELKTRDGFLIVVLFWTVLSLFGSLPFLLSEQLQVSLVDAVFESFSGLTTTGATVLTGLDEMPKAILYYRQQLQWIGGMGIIVLAVAVLPMLGIGGMQLYKAEAPGPVKDSKLTPRIAGTAKALWYIYLTLTVSCALAYWSAGMDLFDAICHAYSTVAIGGFSTYDASMAHFDNVTIELICAIFMLIAGINFSLHYLAFNNFSLTQYFNDPECRTYVGLLLLAILVCFLILWSFDTYSGTESLRHAAFQAISIGTTAGFTTVNYNLWPAFLPVLLIFMSFVGGCAGSTGGGMKVIRFLLLFKQGFREVKKLIHPHAVFTIKLGKTPIDNKIIEAVWGFFAAYVFIFVIMMLILMADGHDQITSFSAVAACMNNLGPGLGEVALNYASLGDLSKWVLCLAMLLGRLEIFTLLVLVMPAFWRR
jgi:trk system potassium uptake protein TrkH